MKRIIIAGLLGGLVLIIWSFVVNGLLGLHDIVVWTLVGLVIAWRIKPTDKYSMT